MIDDLRNYGFLTTPHQSRERSRNLKVECVDVMTTVEELLQTMNDRAGTSGEQNEEGSISCNQLVMWR